MRRTARLSASAAQTELAAALAELRASLGIAGGFPADAEAEARRAAAAPLGELPDLTHLEFLTIDPPGSTDLDQAMHLSTTDGGFAVHYAIADGAIDRIEAAVLAGRVGDEFEAVVVAQNASRTRILLADPAVEASVDGVFGAPGRTVRVRLLTTRIATGTLAFEPVR